MKRFIQATLMFSLLLGFTAIVKAGKQDQMEVQIIGRQYNNTPYSYSYANGSYGIAQTLTLQGATFTLRLPDGRVAIVNCTSKFQERFAGPGNVRSCRIPTVDKLQAEFHGDGAKLIWPVSIDGKKTESETYKIIAVYDKPQK